MNLAQAAHARPPGDPGGANVLRLADVTVRFGGITAVDAVTLDVPGGQVVGLIGPNGAGKTTLLDSVSGLRTPTEGRIVLDGADVTARTASWLSRHGIRRTFQRHQAFGWLTVRQNVLVPLEWRTRGRGLLGDLLGLPHRRRETEALLQRVDEVVELCGLSDVRDVSAATLPIGRLRLLEFARAIVDSPRLLLLDEPTSGLGQRETELLREVLLGLVRRHELTVILVEHDVDFVMGLADRVVCLVQGAVLADGTPAGIRRNPEVIAAYLGN
ncbi:MULTISPECIES: ABC transporter ATP-binding protein [Nonomuraea]|uniref:ABC transporter ATP-binding protein n=1 Tax=Nonomuraea ferruginea TaxID=46174 RepID=A0ABT4T221_9ACTN|nr:ABC transporter ATP-binding protein [Nonomuraea ferruginea]MDA0643175.1 ABC transporter ATP-binding protein [Nonomuraea ferruginea]